MNRSDDMQRPDGRDALPANDARALGAEQSIERVDYDAELRLHNARLRRCYAIERDDRVLDIGCGTGQTTRDAGCMAVAGRVLGVDAYAPAIERARELTRAAGLDNIVYEVADAQVRSHEPGEFDVAISRFGTMFFAEPVAAFGNIAGGLRPGARLVMMVWQGHDRNAWAVSIDDALTAEGALPPVPDGGMDPFSLGEPETVTRVLDATGFADVSFADVREPVYFGRDVATAMEWVRGFLYVRRTLEQLDAGSRRRVLDRLERALARHARGDGVWFDARSWIVTARRA
jgi:SAM-dependent methyltransferase